MAKIKREKLKRSVIHSDIGGHLLSENGKVTSIIDWDDTKETYLVSEPANFIVDHFIISKETLKSKVAVFIKEYQKYVKLNYDEKVALYYLIKRRNLEAISWYLHESKTHKNRKIIKWINELLNKYKSFNKISLNDFISGIN